MKYTLPFLLALDQPVCLFTSQSYHSKTEVCISYQKYAPSDISGCDHVTGSIMKYTLPLLLALDQPVCLFTS